MDTQKIIDIAANALNDKKAKDMKLLLVEDLTVLTEYFIIATATSSTHVRSLADEVEDKLEENGLRPDHIEGKSTGWIVLDYGSVIVHIFTKDQREFYNLDNIWADAKDIDLDTILKQSQGD